jgi:hypothetical protein
MFSRHIVVGSSETIRGAVLTVVLEDIVHHLVQTNPRCLATDGKGNGTKYMYLTSIYSKLHFERLLINNSCPNNRLLTNRST